MSKNLICIMCPMGCNLTITETKSGLEVTGNNCIRGEQYAKEELTAPKRIVTALVRTADGVLPCKTTQAVPKELVFKVVAKINKLRLKQGKLGDVILTNVLNTGADVIITGNKVEYSV